MIVSQREFKGICKRFIKNKLGADIKFKSSKLLPYSIGNNPNRDFECELQDGRHIKVVFDGWGIYDTLIMYIDKQLPSVHIEKFNNYIHNNYRYRIAQEEKIDSSSILNMRITTHVDLA